MICALISPTLSVFKDFDGDFAVENLLADLPERTSGTANRFRGASPAAASVFSHDFRSGFSDHLGVKDGFGLI